MSLANLATAVGRQDATDSGSVVDIITFIEAPWGLGMRLFPVQKVILKAHYGLALDKNAEGFDLDKPIPVGHPNYDEVIDTKPRHATTKIEIVESSEIPEDAFIELTDHTGTRIRLTNGEHWFAEPGDEIATCQSIEDAINSVFSAQFTAEAFYGACQIVITSKGFSTEGNEAYLELTKCEGFRIGLPELEIDHYGYEEHSHHFYGGLGGFYKNRVTITDWRRENERSFTEAEYLEYLYVEGRSNIKTVIPGKERREMILSIGRRSGKCVEGDTLVLTNRGVLRIDSLGDPDGPEYQPLEIGVAQEGQRARGTSQFFYNGGVKPVFKLKTHCGFKLGGTGNHRIKVMTPEGCVEWSYLSDIKEGDQVVIHRNTELWPDQEVDLRHHHNTLGYKSFDFPNELGDNLGLLLGLLVGDGNWKNTQSIAFTADDPETKTCAVELFTEFFGEPSWTPDTRRKRTGALRVHGIGARQFLHDIGWVHNSDRRSKMVPWSIMRSPASVVCSFLRGLFETDGGLESGGKVVSFCSASERLTHEVQTLLLNLGIVSRVKTKWNKTYGRDYYFLTIRGLRHRQAFADRIGFVSRRKMEPLLAGLASAGREGGNTESIPHLRDWCAQLLGSVKANKPGEGWSKSDLRAVLGNTIKPSAKAQVTYPRLEKTLKEARRLGANPEVIRHLQNLFDLDYFYDPVVQIEEGEAPVYDLNVPEGSMFVANGMTNHNTTISACIAAYETYKLIKKGHPQSFYGLPDSNIIQIISVATDKDQAGLLYREVHGHFTNCSYFDTYLANATQTFATFQTPQDIDRFGAMKENPKARFSIKVTFRSCIAKGLRGAGNIVVILDEVAHFTDAGQSSAKAVYDAITPSTSAFSRKDPDDSRRPIGAVEGRIILISSPLGRQGQFFRLFQIGMQGGRAAENMLCIEAPSWEVNPTIPASEFEKHYRKDPRVFFTEYGGQFTDRTKGWIEESKDLLACVKPDLRPKLKAPSRAPHFMGLDVGLVGDGTAVAIGHLDERGNVVADLVDHIQAGVGDYEGQDRLEFDDVADWVFSLSRKFFITKGMFDTWAGIPMEQALAKRGLKQMEAVHHTRSLKSQIFQNFKDMMFDRRLDLYDYPIPDDPGIEHCPYIAELLELQAEVHSKYIITVEAPDIEGKHDDMSDALVRMVWLATNHAGKAISFGQKRGRGRSANLGATTTSPTAFAKARMKARLGGSHPSRMPAVMAAKNRGGWKR